MAIKLRRVSETYRARIYTEDGYYLGEVEDAIIVGNKIDSWKVRVSNRNFLLRGVRGLFIKHVMVKAMGEIWIVSKAVYSALEEPKKSEEFKKSSEVQPIEQEKPSEGEENIKIEKI